MCTIKWSHAATSSAGLQELTGVPQRPAPVLRTSVIALVYSVAEYCVPMWGRCAHFQHIDTQLNIAMRTVSGALRPTNINWLPMLSNIESNRFAVTVLPCRRTRRLSSSRIMSLSRRSYVSHPSRVSDLTGLSWARLHDSHKSKSNGAGDTGAVAEWRDMISWQTQCHLCVRNLFILAAINNIFHNGFQT